MIAIPSFRPAFFGALNPIAKAYADLVGLSIVKASALSNHLNDLTAAGIVPVQLTLGRSEWLARNGSSWRAVIGNAATITGTVTDAAEGQQFPGTSGNYARLNNPLQSAALTDLGMVVVGRALSGVTTAQQMLSGYAGGSGRGPAIILNSSPNQGSNADDLYLELSSAITSGTLSGVSSQKNVNNGLMMAFACGFSGGQTPFNCSGAWCIQTSASTIASLWNGGSTWSIGGRPDNTTSINGAISYALVLRIMH